MSTAMRAKTDLSQLCKKCSLIPEVCLCGDVPYLSIRSQVVVLMHKLELQRTSNTAKLVPLMIEDGEVRVRGARGNPLQTEDLRDDDHRSLLLFPDEGAPVLTPEFLERDERPIRLVVPDGSWRQVRRLLAREKNLHGMERVRLIPAAPSRYRLRSQRTATHLATFEAIAQALGIIEGPEVQAQLEQGFDLFVERLVARRPPISVQMKDEHRRALAEAQ
ncbi:MAG: tRNA-uridine aminocarboxypropyltransferase [Myxococcota bacterium]|nr:tRNA-uridine aminocarboxypropyltransferase [Myxococcota bacterium]